MESGRLQTEWKSANVTPVYKKGCKTEAGNCRPVALTSVTCRLMETIIKTRVISHIEENGLFTPHQHGCTRNKSCLTYHLETLEDWTASLEEGYGVDVLYLDYQKASDTVRHQLLMTKLQCDTSMECLAQ